MPDFVMFTVPCPLTGRIECDCTDCREEEFDGPSCERCGINPAATCECDETPDAAHEG